MTDGSPFGRLSQRRAHLDADNPLRALTETIARVPGGINLGQGVCELPTPALLREAVADAIAETEPQTYTHYAGLPELRAAIARKLRDWNAIAVVDDEVLVTAGSSSAFFAAGLALLDPGDEVILLEPFYSYHRSQLELLGAVPVPVPLRADDLALDVPALAGAIGPRTRAVVLNTPANPSGKVFTRDELSALAAVLAPTDVVVLTDEVYEYLTYDGRRHVSPASLDALAGRTVTIGSFSKTFAITGWRVGYLAAPRPTLETIGRVFDQMTVCAPRPLQRGVTRALAELPASFYVALCADYEGRRARLCAALARAGFAVRPPEGAYYVLADFSKLSKQDDVTFARWLAKDIGIATVPGSSFFR
ncbi:MAG TPA: pyridoxal phosphate-dependent aminotransferase, partial [Solirubrobacteraceae bacterium]